MKETVEVNLTEIDRVLGRLLVSENKAAESAVVAGEQVILSREPCPEILLSANKQKQDIILVQKFTEHVRRLMSVDEPAVLNVKNLSNGVHTPTKEKSSGDDLDVTGSPLKCPFMDGDVSDFTPFTVSIVSGKKKVKQELSYTPVSAAKFGLIASKINLSLSKIAIEKEDCTPLWVVCDGKDQQGTLFVGMHRVGNLISRMLVTSAGPYIGSEELPTLDHLKIHHSSTFPTKMAESSVRAAYEILSGDDDVERSTIKLTCSWKRPLTILTPPAPNATTEAHVTIVCNDPRSAAHQMYQELKVLRGFVTGLRSGEVAWLIHEGDKTVADQIEEVFVSIREKGQRQKKEDEVVADDVKVEEKFFNRRHCMDFIDMLWLVLMKCKSYQELKESLELVFNAVLLGQVRPQIHVRNSTQVGNLVRSLMRGQADLPELTGLTPLNMLIEMGIEKIKKDYINIFQAGELATGEQLSWFVGYTDSMDEAVTQLERLHVALQVVVLMRTYLTIPSTSLVQFTAQALNQLKEGLSSPYSFCFKLSTFSVHQLLNSLKPCMWEVVLHSTHGPLEKTLVCHISQRPLIYSPSDDFEESVTKFEKDESEIQEERHFCTFFTTATDEILY